MRRTQVFRQPFGRLVRCRSRNKTVTACGHFKTELPGRRVISSNRELFHSSSYQQQDLRRFLEEVSFYNLLPNDHLYKY